MTKKKVDLAALDTVKGSNEGFDVQIYDPGTNEDIDIVISVLGKDSDAFNKISRSQNKRRMAKMQKGGFRNVATPPIEEVESDGIELLAACTTGWTGVVRDGKVIEFSKDNAVMIYKGYPWIKEQVDIAIGDRANFIKA
ncbi:hypothetical protein KAR91_26135 [Candidatus Pacearchaeota archaeon]|nr:hypothetical protein [Candidatus Pacearchaeota archaeon]